MTVAPSTLLERKQEISWVRGSLLEASQGQGQLALVTADAGFGKTRLLEEAARHANGSGMVVLRGHGVPGCGPYRPVAEALLAQVRDRVLDAPELHAFRPVLGRLLPGWSADPLELGAAVDPVLVMGEAVLRLLRVVGGESGCLLALDDMHWSDPDSLALLEYLAGALDGTPALVLVAARSDELASPGLCRLRADQRVAQLPLSALGDEAVCVLAASRYGERLPDALEEYVLSTAEGSPLLAEELVDGLLDHGAVRDAFVPRTFAEVVGQRLALLSAGQRSTLTMAAVAGPVIRPVVVARALGVTEASVLQGLRAATRHHLLVQDAAAVGGLRWRHALTRDAVLQGLLLPERVAAARRAARALEGSSSSDPEELALAASLHELGDEPLRAAELNLRLARQAARSGALASALERLALGADLSAAHTELRTQIAAERVRVLAAMGRVSEAMAEGESALALAPSAQRAELALALARAALAGDRFADAARVLSAHVPSDDPRGSALAAHAAFGGGQPTRAVHLARQVVDDPLSAQLPDVLCDALEIVGRHARLSDVDASERAFTRSHDVALEAGLTPARIRALSELGILDGLRRADPGRLQRARDVAAEAGMLGTVAMLDLQIAACLTVRDGLSAAHATAARAADTAERLHLDAVAAAALMFVASGLLAQGRRSDMRRALDRAGDLNGDSVDVRVWGTSLLAMASLLDGDNSQATRQLDQAVGMLRSSEVASSTAWWGVWVVLRTVRDGRVPEPGPEHELALVQGANAAALAYAEAIASAAGGDPDTAAQQVAAADEALRHMPHWWHLMRLLYAQAAAAGGWGDPVAHARDCLAHFEQTEPLLATLARNLLRSQEVPVPRRRRGTGNVPPALRALGVTGRELEVLRLVSESLTNAEIGRRLFLSPRTVETHIKHLMQKLGAARRGELAGAAARLTSLRDDAGWASG